jgi:hypothetical protein
MITFPEAVSLRISRENGRAGHPLSGRKAPEYAARDIRRQPPRAPQMKFRRMDFSLGEGFETTAMGKSTSARRLHAYSGPFRPPIPGESGHPFRMIPATYSGAIRPPPRIRI